MSNLEQSVQTVRKYVTHLSPKAQLRVAQAVQWAARRYVDETGRRCLVGHAADVSDRGSGMMCVGDRMAWRQALEVGGAARCFDFVTDMLGLDAAVALVKDAAGALK